MSGQNNYLEQQVLVLGVGNILLQDEGFGVHVVKEMALGNWPKQVEFIDGGTAGMEMIYLFEGVSRLIIIDSLDANTEPGSIFKFKPGDIANLPRGIGASFHDVGLLEVLHVARTLDCLPETVIFGIQPKTVDWGMELTPELSKIKAKVIELVAQEIVSNGGETSA
ncbi:MAG: HyaD/HybD family hydrogenase maturation endopeptidase [Clostridia bacterium]|nr:HyaD/HybD family hydrogenase maturation endopeptidase [Clostridia bacterium]